MIEITDWIAPDEYTMLFAVSAMRNPMNSWNKSDSDDVFGLGMNDIELARKLNEAGSEHRKFLRMIPVMTNINAPLYWWKQFDTYKVGVTRNSSSTMHKIMDHEFTLDDFATDNLLPHNKKLIQEIVDELNNWRLLYFDAEAISVAGYTREEVWWQVIQLLPSSYMQFASVSMNYEVLYHIYHSRRNHKLGEWHEFCDWIEQLPYFNELIK